MKALSTDEHLRRGSYRRDRHGPKVPVDDRGRLLHGLPPAAAAIAGALFDTYTGFDAAALFTLRGYALSCQRLSALLERRTVNVGAVHAETTINLALLEALSLSNISRPDDEAAAESDDAS